MEKPHNSIQGEIPFPQEHAVSATPEVTPVQEPFMTAEEYAAQHDDTDDEDRREDWLYGRN